MSRQKFIISVTLLALVSLACGSLPQVDLSSVASTTPVPISAPVVAVTPAAPPTLPPPPTPLPPELIQEADAEELLLINLYERVSPAVVSIQAVKALEEFEHPQLPEGIPTPEFPDEPFRQQGEGSGFVLDTQGHIVTNNHVIADTTELLVTLYDGTILPATVVGVDPDSDLAIIKVDAPPESLRPVTWGDSDHVRVGQRAVAIGNPFGFENTLTSGIISGLSRSLPAITGYRIPEIIQTDAAINPGNSGGPLLNSQGEVIGVNSAIVPNFNQSGERSFLGVGFAIPSNLAQRVVPVLIENGEYAHAWIGFRGMDVFPEIAAAMNLSEAKGALIIRVVPNSPAE
jgi:2-alkenal reductase